MDKKCGVKASVKLEHLCMWRKDTWGERVSVGGHIEAGLFKITFSNKHDILLSPKYHGCTEHISPVELNLLFQAFFSFFSPSDNFYVLLFCFIEINEW